MQGGCPPVKHCFREEQSHPSCTRVVWSKSALHVILCKGRVLFPECRLVKSTLPVFSHASCSGLLRPFLLVLVGDKEASWPLSIRPELLQDRL